MVWMRANPIARWLARGGWLAGCLILVAACSQEPPAAANGSATAVRDTATAARASDVSPATPAAESWMETPPAVTPAPAPGAAARSPASPFLVNTVLGLDDPLRPNDYVWDEEGVPDGPIGIVIDLTAQRLYVYRAGVEIGRSVIIYGADDKPTPTGTFPILEKDIDHVSNIYDGAPMPYMLRLTWDGIAIHGSGEIGYEWATHGCIGLPDEFAAILFEEAGIGDQVLVTNGWMTEHYAI